MSTQEEIKAAVIQSLLDVAPDLEGQDLDEAAPLQGTYDLDSADFLRFLTHLQERLGVEIPPRDARALDTIRGAVRYVNDRVMSPLKPP